MITILPMHIKDIAKQKLETLKKDLDNYKMYPDRKNFIVNGIDNIINHMYNEDNSNLIPTFRQEMQKMDMTRNENFLKVFPELKDLYV